MSLRLGIDVGSTTVKKVIMNDKFEIVESSYTRHFSDTKNTVCEVLNEIIKNYPNIKAKSIPQIPSVVTSNSMLPYVKEINKLPIGIDNNEFEIYYHDTDFTEDMGLQDTYEVYKVVDGNSSHWDGVD